MRRGNEMSKRAGAATATVSETLARDAATHAMGYAYKVWGFGEDIALRALLELSDATGAREPEAFVHALVRDWCRGRGPLTPADHVAPGAVLLMLHERYDDAPYLATALELARLHTEFPVVDGVAVHRRDLAPWRDTVWVDCMALDGPFLAQLARTTGDARWAAQASQALLAYAAVLQDDASDLFAHGYDVGTHRTNALHWARGNGWALHGLVDTLEVLPEGHPGTAEGSARLHRLVEAIVRLQHPSGLWHTILDDTSSPLENSTAAFFASGLLKALRLALLSHRPGADVRPTIDAAITALVTHARADGSLEISSATPVGGRATYVEQSLGVYPWGQGPLLLTFTENRRTDADARRP